MRDYREDKPTPHASRVDRYSRIVAAAAVSLDLVAGRSSHAAGRW
ncbi:MAG: hypothetical protein OEV40_28540 [Acidimicrobiia bacterium]|nr:hypothetical protein [Acidimicrobiia bacterium]